MLNRGVAAGETVLITESLAASGRRDPSPVRGARPVALWAPVRRCRGEPARYGRGPAPDLAAALDPAGPVDVVADVVVGRDFELLNVLRPFGRYVTAGGIAGPVVETDLRTVYLKQLTLVGSSFATHEEFAALVDLIRAGRLRPVVAGVYPLHELARAQADFVAKRFVGKLVVTPD